MDTFLGKFFLQVGTLIAVVNSGVIGNRANNWHIVVSCAAKIDAPI